MKLIPYILACAAATMISAQGAAIIYEPFAQTSGSINGKAGGTGLNSWTTSGTAVTVATSPTLNYGNLSNSGGQADVVNNAGIWASATTTTALSNAGLLDDGATLWFSYVFQKTLNGGSNEQSGFAFASERVNPAFNGLNLSAAGYGLGAYTNSSAVTASGWSNSTSRTAGSGSASLQALGSSTLVIGKIQWGVSNEIMNLYTRALDNISTEPTTGGSSITLAGFDQKTLLDTISFGQRNSNGTHYYDEIRFGATYADVAPVAVPEPAAAILGSLGVLMLLRRRRG